MGCCVSSLSGMESQEMVSRCRARKRYMKQLNEARTFLSSSHSFYLRSLRSTGSCLLQFSTVESTLLLHNHHQVHHNNNQVHHHMHHHLSPLPPPPPPPPPMSSTTDTWTTSTSTTNATPLPPPPPPHHVGGSTWDFWDPFAPSSAPGAEEDEESQWEDETVSATATVTATATATATSVSVATPMRAVAAAPSVVSGFSKESEMAVVVRQGKEFVEIIKELDEYFLRAADAGAFASAVLELHSSFSFHPPPSGNGKMFNGNSNSSSVSWSPTMSWRTSSKFGFRKEETVVGHELTTNNNNNNNSVIGTTHSSTIERLYAWEKKLFLEVKNAEKLKIEHEKRVQQLRKLEVKRADYFKTEKTKKLVEKLESQIEVASQAIQSTSNEIIHLRETQLYPQLLDIVKGFMCMWRGMYECHQVQMHIVDQLKFLNAIPSTEPTSEIHRQSTLQLEVELQQWHQSFCNLVKAQRDYIRSLTGWLRLSLFQFNKNPLMRSIQDSTIYSLCEQWQLEIDNVPDKVASEGIKSLWTVIHDIVVHQAEELKQKKSSEVANKNLEKRAGELRSLEVKYGSYSMPDMTSSRKTKDPVGDKRAKVDLLKVKAEEENAKHEKAISATRAMTLNNMQMGLPHVFQAMTGFSSVNKQAFEKIYNQAKNMDQELDVKRLMMS